MKNIKKAKAKKTAKVVPVIQVRAEFGEKNIRSFTLPIQHEGNLVALKAAIREHCPKAIRAEIQYPGGDPEIITLSRKPASILT